MRGPLQGLIAAAATALVAAVPVQADVTYTAGQCPTFPPCGLEVWRSADDGSGARQVTVFPPTALTGATSPAWSPDGRRIAFIRSREFREPDFHLWVTAADGSGTPMRVGPEGLVASEVDWSPTGDTLVVGAAGDLFALEADGSALRRLTGGASQDFLPQITPDGRRVVFQRYGPGEQAPFVPPGANPEWIDSTTGWYSVGLDGKGERRLRLVQSSDTSSLPEQYSALDFSPDGRFAALAMRRRALFTVRTDGRQVRHWPGAVVGSTSVMSWAAGGPSLFAYASSRPGSAGQLQRLGPGTTPPTRTPVPTPPLQFFGGLDWSDGQVRRPPADRRPPALMLIRSLPPTPAGPPLELLPARGVPVVARRRLGYLALDQSGLVRARATIARVAGRRCRFRSGSEWTPPRSCRRPVFFSAREFSGEVRRLRRGRYRIGITAADGAGNRPSRTVLRLVRLR